MKLTLAEPTYLKDSIAIISDLVNEASFKFTPDAVEMIAMDPANVAMVIFKLLSSAFVEFDVKDKNEITINLNNLKQVLRRAKSTDTLSLEVEEAKLKIKLGGKSATRTFYIPIIDAEEKEQKVPELNFPVSVTTSSTIISEAIEDVDVVGESVAFIAEPNKLIVQAEGDLSKAKIEIMKDDKTDIKSNSQDTIRAKYSIEYLKKMITASKIADNVTVEFNKDYPLKLSYVAVDKMFLAFILAPRVEND